MMKIGFCSEEEKSSAAAEEMPKLRQGEPRKSVVTVLFPDKGQSFAYYNDRFDLRVGDTVFVEGKLAGVCGKVTAINCSFKIRLSDYKRIIAVADCEVHGTFYSAGSHFISFERGAAPREKLRGWFLPPVEDEDELVSGEDWQEFPLGDFGALNISPEVAQRGHGLYADGKVRYLSVDGENGYAIVEGSKPYEVEFNYRGGMISNLRCSCYCVECCKHEFAALLQLSEALENIDGSFADAYAESGFFALLHKPTLFTYAVDGVPSCALKLG